MISLVPRPSCRPVFDHLQCIKTGWWEALEMRLVHDMQFLCTIRCGVPARVCNES